MNERRVTLTWPQRAPREASARLRDTNKGGVERIALGGSGALWCGDNVAGLDALERERGECATLVYMDPPFLTGRVHEAVARTRDASGKIVRRTTSAFDDRWSDRASYLEALGARIEASRRVLLPHGSLVVHVDPKTSHYVRVLMDEIFGEECFASEIIWRYRRWPAKTPNFQRMHDVLLRYRKDANAKPRFNTMYEPLAPSTLKTWGTTKQRAIVDAAGRRTRSSSTAEPTAGTPLGDVWEIGVVAPVARERTGYPSQKPEALLERLVRTLSDPGELVVDPYAGSGTTLAAAARLEREFLGMDASAVARATILERFSASGGVAGTLAPSLHRA